MVLGGIDLQISWRKLGFDAMPALGQRERQHASHDKTQEHATIVPIAAPQMRLLLDPPEPFEARCAKNGRSALDGSSLKIQRRTQMSPHRYLEPRVVSMQPTLSL